MCLKSYSSKLYSLSFGCKHIAGRVGFMFSVSGFKLFDQCDQHPFDFGSLSIKRFPGFAVNVIEIAR
jgi:hypothetical protein